MTGRGGRSAASGVFLAIVAAVVLLALLMAGLLLLDGLRHARAEAERVTQAVTATLAHSPSPTARSTPCAATPRSISFRNPSP